MSVIFKIKGRLGNAIYRYFACSIFCLKYNLKYSFNEQHQCIINDDTFMEWINIDNKNKNIKLNNDKNKNYLFNGFYQHDMIYRKYKDELLNYMNENEDHYVLTDGISAGDGNHQKFFIKDIINSPNDFNKYYNCVFHIRLGDRVYINNGETTLNIDSIKKMITQNKDIIDNNSCLLVEKPSTEYEEKFMNEIVEFIKNICNININIESNDLLTDFHIMKNAKTLVCSISTLSWCAAFLSERIEKCYMPDYPNHINTYGHCKKPIENTILYDY